MSEALRFTLLGEPQVHRGDAPLTGFISTKAQALLFYLAVTNQSYMRETLATLFWGDMSESTARKNLTKVLSNLRKLIGPALVSDRQTVGLNPSSSLWVDVHIFCDGIESPRSTEKLGQLQQAVALYRGDFLTGFTVRNAPDFEEWLLVQQEKLHEMMLNALQTLSEELAECQEWSDAIDYTGRLLDMDPLRESAHRQMMHLLARNDQRSAALAQYEKCCQILADELGMPPMSETTDLYNRLKSTGEPPRHNLPLSATPFVGRDTELAQISALLDAPDCRLLTVVGAGGIGKTRLALQAAKRYLQPEANLDVGQPFPDGLYFVSLTSLDSVNTITATLSEVLGFSLQDEGKPQQQLLNYLRQKKLMLIIDSFEHLLLAPLSSIAANEQFEDTQRRPLATQMSQGLKLATDILAAAPGVKFLITSRSRLNVQSEHLFYLAGMDYPERNMQAEWLQVDGRDQDDAEIHANDRLLAAAADYSAVQLFLQSASQVRPHFELTPANVKDVLRICQQVQGMPLAILLAAVWVEMLTPAEIATEIGHSLDFLETTMHDMPPRQRSIRAAFDHSWQMLTLREREIFQQLSVFRGDFARQAANQITGASLRELMALTNKSLLHPTTTGRYTLHELLRQFGLEKLDTSSDGGQVTRDHHCRYYAAHMAQKATDLQGAQQQIALTEIEVDSENIRVAWQWAVAQKLVEPLAMMVDPMCQFYEWRGRYQEGAMAMQQAASIDSFPLKAEILTWQGVFLCRLGQTDRATQLLSESLTLLQNLAENETAEGDIQPEKAFALLQLGRSLREMDRGKAKECYEQSLALYQALENRWGIANALTALGWLVQHWGAYDEAKQLYQEGLTIRQHLGDQRGMASSLKSVGGVALYQGQSQEAEQLIRESIAIHQEMGDWVGIAGGLSKLGETLVLQGKFAEAQSPLTESREIYVNLGLSDDTAFVDAMLGLSEIHLGHPEQALTLAKRALNYFREVGSQRGIAYALLILGWARLFTDSGAKTQQILQECHAIYQEIGQRDELGQALALLGYAAYQEGDTAQAQQLLAAALHTAAEIRAFMPLILSLPTLMLLLLDQDAVERAIELHTLTQYYPLATHSDWFVGRVEDRIISTTTTALPSGLSIAIEKPSNFSELARTVDRILNADNWQRVLDSAPSHELR